MNDRSSGKLSAGLVSISFRSLDPRRIVELVVQAGLTDIEWGGDVHVPHGDIETARDVARMTADAGLKTVAYGSYYRVGGDGGLAFEQVAASAKELCAPTIRVWAGEKGSLDADDSYRRLVVEESRRIADIASAEGMTVSYEFHSHTLTDTNESALRLLEEVSHPAVKSYWQPPTGCDANYALSGLSKVLPWLTNIHVFHWGGAPGDRRSLSEGVCEWSSYFEKIKSSGRNHSALLEFVKDDDPQQFLQDAAVLTTLIRQL